MQQKFSNAVSFVEWDNVTVFGIATLELLSAWMTTLLWCYLVDLIVNPRQLLAGLLVKT